MKFITNRANQKLWHGAIALVLFAFFGTSARAGSVSGVVHNGTNNQPASGVDVILIQLQGGMEPIANTKTDSAGRYHFDNDAIGAGPLLIRAVYRGVMFHQPLTPGTSTVDVTVYEPTTNPQALQITGRLIVFQPNSDKLLVGEEYMIQNSISPPAAFYKDSGDFDFTLPQGADIQQVSSTGPSGMPVTQGTIDKGKGHYAISYAFQPGDNSVRLSYVVPYGGNHATVHISSSYDSPRVLLVAPPTMQIASAGFNAAGTDQGYNVYARDAVKAGTDFDVDVSGTAPPPPDNAAAEQQQPPPDQTNGRDAGPTVEAAPARLDDEKWILLGGLAAIFAVGLALLFRQPVPVVASGAAALPAASPRSQRKNKRGAETAVVTAAPQAPAAATPASLMEQVSQDVSTDVNALKDMLLRIELRRQAGTISDDEYARERRRAEELLRELVQS